MDYINFLKQQKSPQAFYSKEIRLFRLILREDIGAKIFYPRKFRKVICFDYIMGIHSIRSLEKIIPAIEDLGLFVEAYETYLNRNIR